MEEKKMTLEDQDQIIALQLKGMSLEDAIFNTGYEKGKSEHPEGAVWVKASDRLPENGGVDNKVILRGLLNEQGYSNHRFVAYGFRNFSPVKKEMYFEYGSKSFLTNDLEWLDESNEQPVEQKENDADWVDVNERLPNLETKVLVLRPNENSKKNDVLLAYLHDSGTVGRSHGYMGRSWLYGKYWSLPAIVEFNTITHWFPLPETQPYQKQNN